MISSVISNETIKKSNLLFIGENDNLIKREIKKYIEELAKSGHKIFLLDAFWSKERYVRFKGSRYKREIERRYHVKISVEDFLQGDNIFDYMDSKETNILKVKSILGYMSAAELFPVILSKINEDLRDEKVHIFINDFILNTISEEEFMSLYMGINKDKIKFFAYCESNDIPNSLNSIIEHNIEVH